MVDVVNQGKFGWNELLTPDVGAARAFYGDLLGWSYTEHRMPDGGIYVVANLDGQPVAGLFAATGDKFKGVPPHWMGYVTVSDVDGLAGRTASLGGKVLVPPTDRPAVGRFSVITDPTGAEIALMQWAPAPPPAA